MTKIMGIVNVTPDSFYDGGRHDATDMAVLHGLQLVREGAAVLDIGGESTRPGAAEVSVDEEIRRTAPVIRQLSGMTNVPISIDTTKADVAREAMAAGAAWINDVSAGMLDPEMLKVVAETGATYVAMHMRGTPRTMQTDTEYKDLIGEITEYFTDRISACETAGINREKIILDPGIGFGKSREQNYRLLGKLDAFRSLGLPLLVGPSRKSFLTLIGVDDVKDRLPGTLAAVTLCALAGVEWIRVHDVAAAVQAANVVHMVNQNC